NLPGARHPNHGEVLGRHVMAGKTVDRAGEQGLHDPPVESRGDDPEAAAASAEVPCDLSYLFYFQKLQRPEGARVYRPPARRVNRNDYGVSAPCTSCRKKSPYDGANAAFRIRSATIPESASRKSSRSTRANGQTRRTRRGRARSAPSSTKDITRTTDHGTQAAKRPPSGWPLAPA